MTLTKMQKNAIGAFFIGFFLASGLFLVFGHSDYYPDKITVVDDGGRKLTLKRCKQDIYYDTLMVPQPPKIPFVVVSNQAQ